MRHRPTVVRLLSIAAVLASVVAPVATGALPSASAAKVIEGPDVSHFQHPDDKPINWTKVANAGKSFAISKATEGTTYNDPWFSTDYPAELAAGLVHGAYHFARPELPVQGSAMAQAKFFEAAVGDVNTKKTLPPVLDLEVNGDLNPAQLVTWAQDFLLDMRQLTGRTPMLYTYPYFWDTDLGDPTALARYPLWMAEYGVSTAPTADLWQFTDASTINGIPDGVDQSKFLGDSGIPWSTLSDGTVATKWKPSAPGAPVDVEASALGGSANVTWMPGDAGTSIVTGYTVTAQPGGKLVGVGPGTYNATFTGLDTTTSYTFTVTANNAVGTSLASAPTVPVTPTIPTVLNASVQPSLKFGTPLPIEAKLRRADTHSALAGQQVLIFRRSSAAAPWHQIRKLATDTTGVATSTLHPPQSAELEAVFPGSKGVARSTAFESYTVSPIVTAALSATTVKHGAYVALSGTVSPFVAGTPVIREALYNGAWQLRGRAVVSKKGTFRFTLHPTKKMVTTYRVVVAAAGGRAVGKSSRMTLTVT